MATINYGDTVQAPYVLPDPAKRGEFVAEMRPAIIVGFSNHHAAKRGWGWRGDMLVQFSDGHRSWTRIY